MIRVILQGRTGNNLFQYAAGRALAHRHRTHLVLDGSWVNRAAAAHFEHLWRFPLEARYERCHSLIKRLGQRFMGKGPSACHRGPVLMDAHGSPPPDPDRTEDGTLLLGFFQNPDLAASVECELRKELDLSRIALPTESLRFEERLRSIPTVSIHVRRGDYLNIPNTHCVGEAYHERAIVRFRQQFESLRFCVFSDDIAWCRGHFLGPEFLFCDFPAASVDPLHDLRLMAACQHHIIVNSSYSWWGAWLNPSAEKQVISPKMWMTKTPAAMVVPPAWLLI